MGSEVVARILAVDNTLPDARDRLVGRVLCSAMTVARGTRACLGALREFGRLSGRHIVRTFAAANGSIAHAIMCTEHMHAIEVC